MKNIYGCPHCHNVLNPSVKILLVISYKKKQGMILLSPQPGNFKFICDQSVAKAVKPGATVTFSCPVCAEDLTSRRDKKFAELELIEANGQARRAEFSRVFGTHATLIFDGEEVQAYGEDACEFPDPNFFGS